MTVRYERKYLVPNELLSSLRHRIRAFVRPDSFALRRDRIPGYTVRSIYFDSPTFNPYYEKIEGLKDRRKLRIRGYNRYKNGCKVFLEIKRKLENRIAKNRALIPYDTLEALLETGNLAGLADLQEKPAMDDASRFFYHLKKYAQQPANLVVYDREPYHDKFDPGVRITFDKNIRGSITPQLHDLFSNDHLSYLWASHFILEIKYFTDYMPVWARSLVQEFGLRHEALSKYAMGIDKHRFKFM
jgi:hypothetical protein